MVTNQKNICILILTVTGNLPVLPSSVVTLSLDHFVEMWYHSCFLLMVWQLFTVWCSCLRWYHHPFYRNVVPFVFSFDSMATFYVCCSCLRRYHHPINLLPTAHILPVVNLNPFQSQLLFQLLMRYMYVLGLCQSLTNMSR